MPIHRRRSKESSGDSERLGCCFSPQRRTVEYISLNFALSIITDYHVKQFIATSVVSTFIRFQFSSSPPFNCYMASISGSFFFSSSSTLSQGTGEGRRSHIRPPLALSSPPMFLLLPFLRGSDRVMQISAAENSAILWCADQKSGYFSFIAQ